MIGCTSDSSIAEARNNDAVSGNAGLRLIVLQLKHAAIRTLKLATPDSLAAQKRPLAKRMQ